MHPSEALYCAADYIDQHGLAVGRFFEDHRSVTPRAACTLGALRYVVGYRVGDPLTSRSYVQATKALRRFLRLEPGISIARWSDSADNPKDVTDALRACAKSLRKGKPR
jgi:hypothetical protein